MVVLSLGDRPGAVVRLRGRRERALVVVERGRLTIAEVVLGSRGSSSGLVVLLRSWGSSSGLVVLIMGSRGSASGLVVLVVGVLVNWRSRMRNLVTISVEVVLGSRSSSWGRRAPHPVSLGFI